MRKLFTFFAAMLVALAVNAAVINITPTSPQPADNLRLALNGAASGDTIEMAAGTYVESPGDYIAFTGKNVTVRAAEGEEVILQPQVAIRLKEGATAKFVGIKFDCGHLSDVNSYENLIVPADDTEGKSVILEGCELYNWTQVAAIIRSSTSRRLSNITIDKCYFHDVMKSCLFLENTNEAVVEITNSTFANIMTSSSYSAGVIDIRATAGSLLVDHCTFYNVEAMNTDYAAVGKVKLTSGAVVSNCIFAMPVAAASTIRTIRDVVAANNCLVYNYTADSGWGMQSNVTRNAGCIKDEDPLFADAANGDYTLGAGSPALGAGTDGSNLGDPRWWPAAPVAKYGIYIADDIENGSISVDKNLAEVGEEVTVTITPAEGYELDHLTASGGDLEFTVAGDKKSATFLMPGRELEIGAIFTAIVTGCDWANLAWLGTTDAQYANQFKVCVTGELDPRVVNIQHPGFASEIGIYCEGFANADFQSISVPSGMYSVQGAGIVFHLSAFTAKETDVEVICGGGGHYEYLFTVYNDKGVEVIKDITLDVTVPQAGDAVESIIAKGDALFDTFASVVTLPAGANYEIDRFQFWQEDGTFVDDNSTLAANTTYRMGINIAPKEGYAFPMNDDTSIKLDELNLTVNPNGTSYSLYNGWGYFGIIVNFTTGEIPVIAIENVALTVTFPDYGDAIVSGDWYCDENIPMQITSGDADAYYCHGVDFWVDNFDRYPETELLPQKTYRVRFYVYPKEGYTIPNTLTVDQVTVNGEQPESSDFDTDIYQDRVMFSVFFTTGEIPTGLNDIEDGVKAVKFIENGLLFIRKNGVVYNAQGEVVR